jgi:hypothetical protein
MTIKFLQENMQVLPTEILKDVKVLVPEPYLLVHYGSSSSGHRVLTDPRVT